MKEKQGISLIVLVITIIVMIILAAAVVITLSNTGIINKANAAVSKTNIKQIEQLASLAWSEAFMDGARTQSELQTAVNNALKDVDTSKYIINATETGVTVAEGDNTGLNQYGFYFNQPYQGFANGFLYELVVYEDGAMSIWASSEGIQVGDYMEPGTFTYSNGTITVDGESASFSDSGRSIVVDGMTLTVKKVEENTIFYGKEYINKVENIAMIFNEDGSVEVYAGDNEPNVLPAGSVTEKEHILEITDDSDVISCYIYPNGTKLMVSGIVLSYCPHKETTIQDIPVTCEEDGMISAEVCDNCGEIVTEGQKVAATGHSYDEEGICGTCGADKYTNFTLMSYNRSLAGYTDTSAEEWIIPATFYDSDQNIWYKVTEIGGTAFENCTNLVSITIPKTVTNVSAGAFGHAITYSLCRKLTTINVDDANANYCSVNGILYTKDMKTLVYHPVGIKPTSFNVPEGITDIASSAFEGCVSLTSITLPDTLVSIGGSAFYDCMALTNIELPDSVTSIGGTAFMGCESLTSINIPDNLTRISGLTFKGCKSLTEINISENSKLTFIGYQAFTGCRSLTSLYIPAGVTHIDGDYNYGTFTRCLSLPSIDVDSANANYCSVNGVLYNKDMTTLICYPAGKTGNTFVVPDSVTYIYDFAFDYCSNLTDVTIPASVTRIDDTAFGTCTSLARITFKGTVEQWNAISFDEDWNYDCGEIIVTCTNGTVTIPSN